MPSATSTATIPGLVIGGTNGGGYSPAGPAEFVHRVHRDGCAVAYWSGARPLNHYIVGVGVGHDDATFAETGESMAAYYEGGEAFGGRWWEDTTSPFSHGVRYYGCADASPHGLVGQRTPESEAIARRAS